MRLWKSATNKNLLHISTTFVMGEKGKNHHNTNVFNRHLSIAFLSNIQVVVEIWGMTRWSADSAPKVSTTSILILLCVSVISVVDESIRLCEINL